MRQLATIEAYTVAFPRCGEPYANPARLSIVEASGKHFLRTDSAMLDHHGDTTEDELRRIADIMGYHATEEAARAAIARRYPHWETAEARAIMSRIADALRWHGDLVGIGQLADAVGVTREQLYDLARGKTRPTKKHAQAAANYHGKAV